MYCYLGDAWVTAAQVVATMVHPVLFGGGAMLQQQTLPVLHAPATLERGGRFETLTATGALSLTFVQQRWKKRSTGQHVNKEPLGKRRIAGTHHIACVYLSSTPVCR